MYKIKRLENTEIDRSLCEIIIINHNKLLEKPTKNEIDLWWRERLCTYKNDFIWFRPNKASVLFSSLELIPYQVSKGFFNKKVKEWKRNGCGYYTLYK